MILFFILVPLSKKSSEQLILKYKTMFSCDTCKKVFKFKSLLEYHVGSVHDGVTYSCDLCQNITYKSRGGLKIHMETIHKGVIYKCNTCHKICKSKQLLKYHTNTAHEGVVSKCKICDKVIRSYANISEHMKSMHGTETYKCNDCNYVGKTKRMLKVHTGINHGEKNFKCKYCDYKGGFQHRINQHMKKVHLNNKNNKDLKCKQCSFKANDDYDLKRHISSTHKAFFCEYCNSGFNRLQHLNQHRKTFHKENEHLTKPKLIQMIESRKHPCYDDEKLQLLLETKCNGIKKDRIKEKRDNKDTQTLLSTNPKNGEYIEYDIKEESKFINTNDEECYIVETPHKNSKLTLNIVEDDVVALNSEPKKELIEEISDDEDEVTESQTKDSIYLCPVSFCSYSIKETNKEIREKHFESKHKNVKLKSLNFLKL